MKMGAGKSPPLRKNASEPANGAGSEPGAGTLGTVPGQTPQGLIRQILSELMQHASASDNYEPAELKEGKESIIVFRVKDPTTGAWVRKREKLNHIKDLKVRKHFAAVRVRDLNIKLAMGWNPLVNKETARSVVDLPTAIASFLKAKRRDGLEQDSMRSYESLTTLLVRWLQAKNMDHLAITVFAESHAHRYLADQYEVRGLSNRTYNNYLQFYTSMWNWFKHERYVGSNPFGEIPRKRTKTDDKAYRPPTESERALIREYLNEHNPRYFTFCLLCFHMGIRPKETFMLKPRDFHMKSQAIVVDKSVAKNDRTQGVAIPNNLMPHILELGLDRQHPDHYVFSDNYEPGPIKHTSRTSGRTWSQMREALGLPKDVKMYQVKNAGGVELVRAGLGAVDLMNHFRHHDLAMTTIYTKESSLDGIRTVLDKEVKF